jgi:PAS domain S-box-containing protein
VSRWTPPPGDPAALRDRAEALARDTAPPDDRAAPTPEDAPRLLHELRTHQIELELQNEELRRAQVELDAARARYFDLYDLAPVGYCTVSEPGLILEANLTAASLLGLARSALVRQPLTRFVMPADQDLHYQHRRRLLQTGEPQHYELRLVRPDGTSFWAELSATVAPADDGQPECRLVLTDVTQRKAAEAERISLADQLEQARRLEAIGRLAGGVAHDFNNMLSVILSSADLALLALDPAASLHAELSEIRQAARRSADLTRQLLAFARQQVIAPVVLDVGVQVERLIGLLRTLVGEAIALDWRPEPALWPVLLDPTQLDQILTNLCANARDAIPGTGRVTLGAGNVVLAADRGVAHPGVGPGEYLRLSVSDDGRGLSPEAQEHLFEPFYTTKVMGKGVGLGLATIHGIVRQNAGSIEVRSEPGRGTTFEVLLPRHRGAVERPVRTAAPTFQRGHETVLLVEDEPALLRLTARMLRHLGYTVHEAISPDRALALAEEHAGTIDLLVTDVMMPRMNGRELARSLQSRWPRLRCLLMSGYPSDVLGGVGVGEPGHCFLQKPFSAEALATLVRRALE